MLEMIKAIVPGVPVMRDLPERDDFITQLLKIRGPLLNIRARLRLIRLSPAIARRCMLGVRRVEPYRRGVQLTLVVGQENDDVRRAVRRRGR